MKGTDVLPRLREALEHDRWVFCDIHPSYTTTETRHGVDVPLRDHRIFRNESDLEKFTTMPEGRYFDGILAFDLPTTDNAIGCRVYGRRAWEYPGDVKFFAYREGTEASNPIFAQPPRIESDERELRLISGNSAAVMYQKPHT